MIIANHLIELISSLDTLLFKHLHLCYRAGELFKSPLSRCGQFEESSVQQQKSPRAKETKLMRKG